MMHALLTRESVVVDLDRLQTRPSTQDPNSENWDPIDGLIAVLCEVETAWAESRWQVLADLTDLVERRALSMGLTTFARVAGQTSELAIGADAVALSASVARLVRVGEASLAAILDLQDQQDDA